LPNNAFDAIRLRLRVKEVHGRSWSTIAAALPQELDPPWVALWSKQNEHRFLPYSTQARPSAAAG
jgi:hypothetical protein